MKNAMKQGGSLAVNHKNPAKNNPEIEKKEGTIKKTLPRVEKLTYALLRPLPAKSAKARMQIGR